MVVTRIFAHSISSRLGFRHIISTCAEKRLIQTVSISESGHTGQIRVVIEARRALVPILLGETPRKRAEHVFMIERVWDTEQNTGVLIYLCLADKSVEIVTDRSISRCTSHSDWTAICNHFCEQVNRIGIVESLEKVIIDVGHLLRQNLPLAEEASAEKLNELPDSIVRK